MTRRLYFDAFRRVPEMCLACPRALEMLHRWQLCWLRRQGWKHLHLPTNWSTLDVDLRRRPPFVDDDTWIVPDYMPNFDG